MKISLGSLCSGIGGLDLAVEALYGAELSWVSEIDEPASLVLAKRFGVPNLGDFRGVDPDPVDILTAGFPCQPVSHAGHQMGVEDERWLFDDICTLVGRMEPRPRLLVFENVLGLLTANGGDAMARVVEGLARLGYVGSWRTVRACDAGAPHRRGRIFLVAHPDGGAVPQCDLRPQAGRQIQYRDDPLRLGASPIDFGRFQLPISRWAQTIGRPAPEPLTSTGDLAAVFVEWMMGFDAGWATDVIERTTSQMKCLGNAVVPQQAMLGIQLCSRP